MVNNNKKKICIVVSSLGKGGAERSSSVFSKMFFKLGHDVYIVSVLNYIDYDFEGTLLNLGDLKDKNDSIIGKYQRFMIFRKFILNEKFDIIIDSRTKTNPLKEFFIHRFFYKYQNLVYTIHSSKLDSYLPKSKWAFNLVFKSVKEFVCVSEGINEMIKTKYNIKNVRTIYNAVNITENEHNSKEALKSDFEYVLYYGRLEDRVKNISLLMDAYKTSKLMSNNIKLLILGDGSDKDRLIKMVETFKLEDSIMFLPYTDNPFPYIKKAKYTVLTSRYEGFPRVILESLSMGVPVISVDCQSGPNEIIKSGYNGLLVDNYNVVALANAMNSFIFDDNLYQVCKKNAQMSVEKFSFEKISKEWDELINELS